MFLFRWILRVAIAAVALAASVRAQNAAARAATADEIAFLTDALEKTASDLNRWAYTESRVVRDAKGRVKIDTLVRYDPSLPYARQWTPLLVNGKPPSAADCDKYRRQGERAQRRDERGGSDRRPTLGEAIDVRRATVAMEDPHQLVFEIPLRKDRNERFPPEKFQVLARLNRDLRTVENISVLLRGSFRTRLVVKVKSGEASLDFTVVDPKHPPTLTAIRGDAEASILFFSVGGELDLKRTELKRVRPYDERFDVKIGPLKALDF
ncbi:MAG: hypothetical protein HY736_09735 [Verrucomicrobia bacterium]|nr:hypothetical protein [Verrucomicrobiota bacterium]